MDTLVSASAPVEAMPATRVPSYKIAHIGAAPATGLPPPRSGGYTRVQFCGPAWFANDLAFGMADGQAKENA